MFKTRWVFTLNNYTEEEYAQVRSFCEERCTYSVVGKEIGAQETPHLQGFVVLKKSQRLSFLRRRLSGRAHYEPARGTNDQAATYCKKEGDFWEHGTCPTSRGKGAAWESFRDWLTTREFRPADDEIFAEFPSLYGQYPDGVRKVLDMLYPESVVLPVGAFVRWQSDLADILDGEADDRKVYFYVDPKGGSGKSYFCKYYLSSHQDGQYLRSGKRDDLAHALNIAKRVFLFDVPRGGMVEHFQYNICEQIKDGLIFSPKYDSRTKVISHACHVIVFCNEEPNMTKLSEDRYVIERLSEIEQHNIIN